MSDAGMMNRDGGSKSNYGYGLSTDGRWAVALGVIALALGVGAIGAGVYVGFWMAGMPLGLPGALAEVPTETIAMGMVVTGGLTTMLGGISLQRAQEM
jgi:hypothetical protein